MTCNDFDEGVEEGLEERLESDASAGEVGGILVVDAFPLCDDFAALIRIVTASSRMRGEWHLGFGGILW